MSLRQTGDMTIHSEKNILIMSKAVLIAIAIAFPLGVSASNTWNITESTNTLSIEGSCPSQEVNITLYQSGKNEPVYSSGAHCVDGRFAFSDNLLQWKSLENGTYELAVDGDKGKKQRVVIDRPSDTAPVSVTPVPDAVVETKPDSITFLDAFVALQQSLTDMRSRLAESDYPDIVKAGLDAAIDGIDTLAGKMSDILFAADSRPTDTGETATSAETTDATKTHTTPDGSSNAISVPTNAKIDTTVATSEVSGTAENAKETTTSSTIDTNGALASGGLSVSDSPASGLTSGDK